MMIKRRRVKWGDARLAPFMIRVTGFAERGCDLGVEAVKTSLRCKIPRNWLVTIAAQARLCGLIEWNVTGLALAFQLFMAACKRAGRHELVQCALSVRRCNPEERYHDRDDKADTHVVQFPQ